MINKNIIFTVSILFLIGCSGGNPKNGNEDSFQIDNFEKTESISVELKKHLAYMGNEERLAFDIYNKFFEFHSILPQYVKTTIYKI